MAGICFRSFSRLLNKRVCSQRLVSDVDSRGMKLWLSPTLRCLKARQEKLRKDKKIPVIPRSALVDWNRGAELYAFGKRLSEEFHIEVLNQAFVHRSYIIQEEAKQAQLGVENPKIDLKDNRELSKLGQELISKYVTKYVSYCFKKLPLEGIKGIHDYLTSDQVLASISQQLGTKEIILCDVYPPDQTSYIDAFTAIVGALYQSQGEDRTFLFVRDFVVTQLAGKDVNDFFIIEQPMAVLTEILARDGRPQPEPRLIGQNASQTVLATYRVGLYCDKQLIGQSGGESVDIAVEMAAREALKKLFNTTESAPSINFTIDKIDEPPVNQSIHEWRATVC